MIDPGIANQFQPYLQPRERVVWTGRPAGGIRFVNRDLFLIPFSIMWGGFAIFWETTVISTGWSFGAVWGIPFVLIGLFMIFGRFFVDAWIRSRLAYAITTERALVSRRLRNSRILSSDLSVVALEQGGNGTGTLRFGQAVGTGGIRSLFGAQPGMGLDIWFPALSDRVEFLAIKDVMAAYRLVGSNVPSP